ncbi:ribose 1,5-bisphosphokinase [Oleiphilus messinensis]|nr:ribose 1,5-bisphosphokinase [Oleiphilus messinensis]
MTRENSQPLEPIVERSSHNQEPPNSMARAKLFYMMGPSGSGKDSILKACREHAELRDDCFVAHRYITRKPEVMGENHIWLSSREFQWRVLREAFAMYWQANGYYYGIGAEIDHWMGKGINVIVNGSRDFLEKAQSLYPNQLVPIYLSVSQSRLRERLLKRGRESSAEIEARLRRAEWLEKSLTSDVNVIDNNRTLDDSVDQFLQIVNNGANNKQTQKYRVPNPFRE